MALRLNELNSRIVTFNCWLDSGRIIEGNECTYKKDGTQERTLHVTTPKVTTPNGIGTTKLPGEPHWTSSVYEAKMT